jgi:hypothetical protein
MTGAAVQNRAVPLQACGPREPHPRQVDILLDKGIVKHNGRPPVATLIAGGGECIIGLLTCRIFFPGREGPCLE